MAPRRKVTDWTLPFFTESWVPVVLDQTALLRTRSKKRLVGENVAFSKLGAWDSWLWWLIAAIPASGRLMSEDHGRVQRSLSYIVTFRQCGLHSEILFQNSKKKKKLVGRVLIYCAWSCGLHPTAIQIFHSSSWEAEVGRSLWVRRSAWSP